MGNAKPRGKMPVTVTLSASDDQPGALKVALLEYGLWEPRFGSDRGRKSRPANGSTPSMGK
jgi:hypothetical protein